MPSKEGKRRGYEKTKGHISVPKPSGNYTKTYAEVVGKRGEAWKEKMANDNGIPKKKEVKTAETTEEQGRRVSMEELEQQIVVMRDMQQEQENKLEDLVLMCLALKNELNLRLGQGSDRKERQYDEGGFDNGGKIVEEDRNSNVLETPIEEEEKSLNGEEEKVEASPEGDGPIAVEQVGDKGVGKFCKAAGALEDSVHSEEGGCGEGNFDMEVEVEEVEEEEEDIDFVAEEMGFDKINGASGNDGIRLVSGNNSKHRSLHYALNTKPTSLRFNHLGSSSGLVLLSKRKKKQASVLGLEDRVEQLSSSRTDSIEPEIGKEFTSKHNREHDSREREEAEATLEVGRLVGVSFEPNNSSAIDKLMAMGA